VHLVFVQAATGRLPENVLRRNAATHFDASIALTELPAPTDAYCLELFVGAERADFVVHTRSRTNADIALATEAEERGNAAGMAGLAARCSHVWLLEPHAGTSEWIIWECCALLALTALGPVLPEDRSTLLGVRGAKARADRLRTSA
jgi:hypothetical protein